MNATTRMRYAIETELEASQGLLNDLEWQMFILEQDDPVMQAEHDRLTRRIESLTELLAQVDREITDQLQAEHDAWMEQEYLAEQAVLQHEQELAEHEDAEPETCEHGLSAWLCEDPINHYPADL